MPEEIVRRRIVFYGSVQGVGFRYRAYYAAMDTGVTGWVRNDDQEDTVTMEAQGSTEQIHRMIYMIQQGRYVSVEDIRLRPLPVDPDERSFKVVGY